MYNQSGFYSSGLIQNAHNYITKEKEKEIKVISNTDEPLELNKLNKSTEPLMDEVCNLIDQLKSINNGGKNEN